MAAITSQRTMISVCGGVRISQCEEQDRPENIQSELIRKELQAGKAPPWSRSQTSQAATAIIAYRIVQMGPKIC